MKYRRVPRSIRIGVLLPVVERSNLIVMRADVIGGSLANQELALAA